MNMNFTAINNFIKSFQYLNLSRTPGILLKHCFEYSCKNTQLQCRSLATYSVITNSPLQYKKPRTPYLIFSNLKVPELRVNNPELKITELSKMVGKLWNELSEDEKDSYRMKYLEERSQYELDQKKYMEGLTEEEKLHLEQEKKEKRRIKFLKKIKMLKKELGKPKAINLNPYLIFLRSKYMDRGEAPITQYIQGVSDFWKKMPEEDKETYVEQARENSIRYRKELAEWESKVVELGHTELVTNTKLRAILKKNGKLPKNTKSKSKKIKSAIAGKSKKINKKKVTKEKKSKSILMEVAGSIDLLDKKKIKKIKVTSAKVNVARVKRTYKKSSDESIESSSSDDESIDNKSKTKTNKDKANVGKSRKTDKDKRD